jgi:hypothetical protein
MPGGLAARFCPDMRVFREERPTPGGRSTPARRNGPNPGSPDPDLLQIPRIALAFASVSTDFA